MKRRLLVFVVLGCGLLAATVVGTNWLTDGHAQDNHQPPPADPAFVVGFGFGDVESRVINLHPSQPVLAIERAVTLTTCLHSWPATTPITVRFIQR